MTTKLARISDLSKANPEMKFSSNGHMIDYDMPKACHNKMDGSKAVGIDGITKAVYVETLDENLKALIQGLKCKGYKPKLARRVEISKDNGKTAKHLLV